MWPGYLKEIAAGTAPFAAAPVKLTNPSAGQLATALAALTPPRTVARAYRVLSADTVTITAGIGSASKTTTWAHLAGEGYPLPLTDVIAAASIVLVFY